MDDYTLVQVRLPKKLNYKLMVHMAKMNLKERRNKADEIIRLMEIGLLSESTKFSQ